MATVTQTVTVRQCDRCGEPLSAKRCKALDGGADKVERATHAAVTGKPGLSDLDGLCAASVARGIARIRGDAKQWSEAATTDGDGATVQK